MRFSAMPANEPACRQAGITSTALTLLSFGSGLRITPACRQAGNISTAEALNIACKAKLTHSSKLLVKYKLRTSLKNLNNEKKYLAFIHNGLSLGHSNARHEEKDFSIHR